MEQVLIKDLRTGKYVDAILLKELSFESVNETDLQWLRVKQERLARLDLPTDESIESDDWNWPKKLAERRPEHRFFGIGYEGNIQGLMQLNMSWHGRLPERPGLVYIEHLETAPWNQERYVGRKGLRFARVGSNLIEAAGFASEEAGFSGRLALHALPQSEEFYRKFTNDGRLVFKDLSIGIQPYPELRYFETFEG